MDGLKYEKTSRLPYSQCGSGCFNNHNCIYMPQIVSAVIRSYDWLIVGTQDNALSKIVPVLHLVSIKVSTLTLVFFSVERFLAISYPLRIRLTSRSIIITKTRTWLVSSDVHLPPLHGLELRPGGEVRMHETMVCLVANQVESYVYSFNA